MSKAKKQKAKGLESPQLLSTQVLEERAAADLERRNYRRAKEWLKELSKRNKELYQPALIDCYQKLAGQMLEKGLRNEARTVFERIRILTGRPVDERLEAKDLTLGDDYLAAALAMIARRGDEKRPPLDRGEERFLADSLVIAFEDIPALRENHPELQKDLLSVRAALEHLSAGRFSDAQLDVKSIARGSIFSDWRLFIKGLCAFYAGDDVKAREALHRFENNSLLYRAARPFIFIIDDGAMPLARDEAKEPLLMDICRILNRPELEHVLPRADYLWRTGRHADSLEHVMRSASGFPTLEPGLLGALSAFYFNVSFHMNPGQGEKYLRDIHGILKKRPNCDIASLLYVRSRALFLENNDFLSDSDLLRMWEQFLSGHRIVSGENSRLRALVYAHLGNIFAEEDGSAPPERWYNERKRRKFRVRNYERAEEAYIKSIMLHRQDRDVHLSLLKLYEKAGDNAKRNRKLDEISRLFPDDKDVLLQNGNNCIERKAYLKGVEYLRRAHALDPLSRTNREALGVALIKTSLHFARQIKIVRCRKLMKEALELGEADSANMTLGRPYLLIRMAIFEWISGGEEGEEEGNLLLAEALKNGNEDGRLPYFAYMIGRTYDVGRTFIDKLDKAAQKAVANLSPAGVAAMAEVAGYIRLLGPPALWFQRERELLNRRALKAAEQPCLAGDAEKIIRYAFDQTRVDHDLISRYVNNILRRDPKSPLFLYFRYLNEFDPYSFEFKKQEYLKSLKEIHDLAVERNERLLVNLLDRDIRKIETELSSPGGSDYGNKYDFDDEAKVDDKDFDQDDFKRLANDFIEEMNKFSGSGGKSSSPRKKKGAGNAQPSLFDDPKTFF
jgi:tetratricopeptide (TPR) repeat protein